MVSLLFFSSCFVRRWWVDSEVLPKLQRCNMFCQHHESRGTPLYSGFLSFCDVSWEQEHVFYEHAS